MGQQEDLLTSNVKNLVFENVGRDSQRVDALDKLGLLSDSPIDKKNTPMDTLTHYLSKKLSYRELKLLELADQSEPLSELHTELSRE